MPTTTESAKTQSTSDDARPRLNKKQVTIALASRGGEKGWTRYDLADAIGADVSTVSRAINHGQFPNVIRRIAKELGLTC